MKTLKKTLCLVLAVVMAVGVLILPANAAGYKDLSDKTEINENYAIAVETLTNMGIISGKASGTTTKFDPKGTLLRQEAAILLVNVMMKPSEKDILLAGYEDKNMFNDISGKDVYARREINYLASLGIVSGKDAELGLFKPHATLTTFELLTMLRKVAEIKNGYVTEDGEWTTQAVKFAVDYGAFGTKDLKARLFTNVDTDPNRTPTREETAQLIFNVITNKAKANITGTYTVTVTEGTEKKVFPNVTLEQAMMLSLTYGDKASIEADGVGGTSIGDLVYGLNINSGDYDVFMRPYKQYDNSGKGGDGKTIYKQFDPDPMLTFTSAGIDGMEALCKKLDIPTTGEDQVKQIALRFFRDGVEITHEIFSDTKDKDYKVISTKDTGTYTFSVAGESVEVYYMGTTSEIPYYYIVRISNIPHVIQKGEIADGKLTLEKKVHDQDGVITRNAVVVDAGDLAVGDVVVYHRSDKVAKKPAAYDVTPVVGVEGIITAKSISNDPYFRVGSNGGKDYLAAKAVDAKNGVVRFNDITVKNSQIFYYYDGYVVAMKSLPNASASDYVYVLSYQAKAGAENTTTGTDHDLLPKDEDPKGPAAARAKILNPITGTVSIVDIAISYNAKDGHYYYTDVRGGISTKHDVDVATDSDSSYLGYKTFVKLTDGSYVLSDVGTDTRSANNVTIHEGRAQVTLKGNQVASNDTVVYLAKTTDGGKTYSVTKWTGYKNFKNVLANNTTGALAILTPDGYIDTLFVLGEEAVTPVNNWYVFTGCGEKYIEENGATLYNYNFLLNGQPVVYSCLDDGTTASTATHTKLEAALKDAGKDKVGSVYTLTFDVNGMLEKADCKDVASSDSNYVVGVEVKQINDEFIVAGDKIYYLDAATVVYDKTPIGSNELEVGATVSIYYMGGDDDVTTTPAALIVITKAAPDEFYQAPQKP